MLLSLDYPIYEPYASRNNWNWTLQNTTSAPYNLSGTISKDYEGWGRFVVDTVSSCAYSSKWQFFLNDFTYTNLSIPTINLQFDDTTANLSLQGYVVANPVNDEGQVPGQFRLTFSGVIDKYHSDILRNDTSIPTWLRTVGFNNNSENIGYTNTSSGSTTSHLMGSLSLTAIVSALWLVI